MRLDEIKNGMYVKLRNDALALVVADKFVDENGKTLVLPWELIEYIVPIDD